jgi:hypothetical protein
MYMASPTSIYLHSIYISKDNYCMIKMSIVSDHAHFSASSEDFQSLADVVIVSKDHHFPCHSIMLSRHSPLIAGVLVDCPSERPIKLGPFRRCSPSGTRLFLGAVYGTIRENDNGCLKEALGEAVDVAEALGALSVVDVLDREASHRLALRCNMSVVEYLRLLRVVDGLQAKLPNTLFATMACLSEAVRFSMTQSQSAPGNDIYALLAGDHIKSVRAETIAAIYKGAVLSLRTGCYPTYMGMKNLKQRIVGTIFIENENERRGGGCASADVGGCKHYIVLDMSAGGRGGKITVYVDTLLTHRRSMHGMVRQIYGTIARGSMPPANVTAMIRSSSGCTPLVTWDQSTGESDSAEKKIEFDLTVAVHDV